MTKVVVFTHKSGVCAVEKPAVKFAEEVAESASLLGVPLTPEQIAVVCVGKAMARHAKEGAGAPLLCDEADLPSDRTFRAAWERGEDVPVTVNMEKAREIAKRAIRTERAPLFGPVDSAAARVIEMHAAEEAAAAAAADEKERAAALAAAVEKKGKALQPILAKKQQLRDAPADPRLAEAADPDALKAAMEAVIAEMKA